MWINKLFVVPENYTKVGGLRKKDQDLKYPWRGELTHSTPTPPHPVFPMRAQHSWHLEEGVRCLVPRYARQREHQEALMRRETVGRTSLFLASAPQAPGRLVLPVVQADSQTRRASGAPLESKLWGLRSPCRQWSHDPMTRGNLPLPFSLCIPHRLAHTRSPMQDPVQKSLSTQHPGKPQPAWEKTGNQWQSRNGTQRGLLFEGVRLSRGTSVTQRGSGRPRGILHLPYTRGSMLAAVRSLPRDRCLFLPPVRMFHCLSHPLPVFHIFPFSDYSHSYL